MKVRTRLGVQHTFQWLVYHSELWKGHIPYDILDQAVRQSTSELISDDLDDVYDFEVLRDYCGCLITVSQTNFGVMFGFRTIAVSFAHYTVREYLQSSRILKKKCSIFSLDLRRIEEDHATIAFRQALAIQPLSLDANSAMDGRKVSYDHLKKDFTLYCATSSLMQLRRWSRQTLPNLSLIALAEAFVNPHSSGYFARRTWFSSLFDCQQGLHVAGSFWDIHWEKIEHPDSAVFLHLLLLGWTHDNVPNLAIAFATTHSMPPILRQKVVVELPLYQFEGSLFELIAHIFAGLSEHLRFVLSFIDDHQATQLNITSSLLLYTCSYVPNTYENMSDVQRLIDLGAKPDGPTDAFVSPLQIVTERWDSNALRMLLKAGADPNAVGRGMSVRTTRSVMEEYKGLHGLSPLYIIRKLPWRNFIQTCMPLRTYTPPMPDKMHRKRIEDCLLEYGAIEIGPGSREDSRDSRDQYV